MGYDMMCEYERGLAFEEKAYQEWLKEQEVGSLNDCNLVNEEMPF